MAEGGAVVIFKYAVITHSYASTYNWLPPTVVLDFTRGSSISCRGNPPPGKYSSEFLYNQSIDQSINNAFV